MASHDWLGNFYRENDRKIWDDVVGSQRYAPSTFNQIQAQINQVKQTLQVQEVLKNLEEKMEPYFVVVLLQPTKKEEEDGAVAEVVVDATVVLAKDTGNAVAKALGLVPKEHANKDSRLEVRVLPFQKVK